MECTIINTLGAVISTRYLTLRYSLLEGRVGTIPGGQQVASEFYLSILETTKEEIILVGAHHSKVTNVDFKSWDPILGVETERIKPIEDLKEAQISHQVHQVTKICISLSVREERELVDRFQRNIDLLAWGSL